MLNAEEKKKILKKPKKRGSVLIKARGKHGVACICQRTNFSDDKKISFF